MKKLLFSLAALPLLLLPVMNVFAGQVAVTEINPFLTGGQRQVTVREIPEGVGGGEFQACDENAHDYNSFKLAVLRRMRAKDTNFTICFQSGYQPTESVFVAWWEQMKKDQDVPWLNNSWLKADWTYYLNAGNLITKSTYTFSYWHNQAQEAQLESGVRDRVRQLINVGMDMPSREKAIHDWVVHHVTYDQSGQKYSDYNAFFEQSAVCEGYTLLTDRMLAMAGVEDKIVFGQAGGDDHAWNIVKLCGSWFHLDTTWDDPTDMGPDNIRWDYFNLSDGQMGADHSWNYADCPACNTTYVDGFCAGQVTGGCSIFEPQKCLNEVQCINASGTWNGTCSVPGSGGGGGGGNGFPSTSQTPVMYPASVYPSATTVRVPAGLAALTPRMSGVDCNDVVGGAIAYIYVPMAHFGLNVPAAVSCSGGVATVTIGAGSIDFSGYPGTYYIYFGYVDGVGTIYYNAYELIVQ